MQDLFPRPANPAMFFAITVEVVHFYSHQFVVFAIYTKKEKW